MALACAALVGGGGKSPWRGLGQRRLFFLWLLLRVSSGIIREKSLAVIFARSNQIIFIVALAAIAAILLNPYGIQLPFFLLRTATVARPEIGEWQPIALVSIEGLVYILLLALVLTGLIFSRKERSPVLVILLACTAVLPLLASRYAAVRVSLCGADRRAYWRRMGQNTTSGKSARFGFVAFVLSSQEP